MTPALAAAVERESAAPPDAFKATCSSSMCTRTHRPHSIRLAAARHFHHQLHICVVVAVASSRHVHELVRETDVPAQHVAGQSQRSQQAYCSVVDQLAASGTSAASNLGPRPRARSHTAPQVGTSCLGSSMPLRAGPSAWVTPAWVCGGARPDPQTGPLGKQLWDNALRVRRYVLRRRHRHEVEHTLPTERLVRPPPHGADTLGRAHCGSERSTQEVPVSGTLPCLEASSPG
jgi:hypothetical protein